jgi:hypothetical protein
MSTHAFELDEDEGGTCWADAITEEVDSLLQLDRFAYDRTAGGCFTHGSERLRCVVHRTPERMHNGVNGVPNVHT